MTRISILLVAIFPAVAGLSQPTWVNFREGQPSQPVITVTSSGNQLATCLVELTGMYEEMINSNGANYMKLHLPGGELWGNPGEPGLPYISKKLSMPECAGIGVSVEAEDSVVYDDYNLAPVPARVADSSSGTLNLEEIFIRNDSIYATGQFLPGNRWEVVQEGYLRNQRVFRLVIYPFRYHPSLKQLVVYTRFQVSLEFQQPQSEATTNNGLMNRLTQKTLLNFTDQSVPPVPVHPSITPGTVTWRTLTSPGEAAALVADYLIIADDQFVNPAHSAALQSLASHRAQYDGYDVVIVSAGNILELNFPIDPPPDPNWESESEIRSFIKMVFDGGHAAHTYDGRLAFVCLVGHAGTDDDDTGMLTSYDPDPTCMPGAPGTPLVMNDFYFSCVTKDTSNHWDLLGDLFIGRLSARNEMELFNIVSKIRHNETEYSFEGWRYNNTLAYGGPGAGPQPSVFENYFTVELPQWLNAIYGPVFTTTLIKSETILGNPWNEAYMSHVNNAGTNIVWNTGHGTWASWCDGDACYAPSSLTRDYKIANFANTGKYPFAMSQSCRTGAYAGAGPDGIATATMSFAPDKGYVAYLGSTLDAGNYPTLYADFPRTLQERIVCAIYSGLSTNIGEAVLEARMGVSNMGNNSWNPFHFQHNLLADPAYDVMAPGYEITHNTTLPAPEPNAPATAIRTVIHVRPGVTLTLETNAVVEFYADGQLIIDEGAILAIGDHVTIRGQNELNRILVKGTLCGVGGGTGNPVPVTDLHLEALNGTSWKGIAYNNPELIVRLSGGTVSDCMLSGRMTRLETSGSQVFTNSSLSLDQTTLLVDDCHFVNSNILLTNHNEAGMFAKIINSTFQGSPAEAVIRIEHYPAFLLENNQIVYEQGAGIDLYYSGCSNGEYAVRGNTIENTGSALAMSWGIRVYRSFADIENNHISHNRYGVSCLNQSQVRLIGNPGATSESETQQIINNYQNQVRAGDNSFPFYFHNNVLRNQENPGNTWLIYYDNLAVPVPPEIDNSTLFNVKCNCFENNYPTSQLYPPGWYLWSVWCPPSSCSFDDPGREDFEEAMTALDAGDYTVAEEQFKAVIDGFPGTKWARESAKKLVSLERVSGQDFAGLSLFLDTVPGLQSDSLSLRLVYRLKNLCAVEAENFAEAIQWYENDILNPDSESDSIYSLIDLSDTYLLMAGDTLPDAPAYSYTGAMAHYKPKDRQMHEIQTQEWIRLLFRDPAPVRETGEPGQDRADKQVTFLGPNPGSGKAECTIFLKNPADIRIRVTNAIGQEVFVKNLPDQPSGVHTVLIDLTGRPHGIYVVSLLCDNITIYSHKMIKI